MSSESRNTLPDFVGWRPGEYTNPLAMGYGYHDRRFLLTLGWCLNYPLLPGGNDSKNGQKIDGIDGIKEDLTVRLWDLKPFDLTMPDFEVLYFHGETGCVSCRSRV